MELKIFVQVKKMRIKKARRTSLIRWKWIRRNSLKIKRRAQMFSNLKESKENMMLATIQGRKKIQRKHT